MGEIKFNLNPLYMFRQIRAILMYVSCQDYVEYFHKSHWPNWRLYNLYFAFLSFLTTAVVHLFISNMQLRNRSSLCLVRDLNLLSNNRSELKIFDLDLFKLLHNSSINTRPFLIHGVVSRR